MGDKRKVGTILNILIVLCALLSFTLLLNMVESSTGRNLAGVAIFSSVVFLGAYELHCLHTFPQKKKQEFKVSTLVLLSENDRSIKVWDLTDKIGLIIGKSSEEFVVDIDLSETDFHTYIDNEHAILNYESSGWWLQDTSSRNGLSVIRKGQEILPGYHTPARLEPGDIICIAKHTRIGVN